MQVRGALKKLKGEAQVEVGKAKDAVKEDAIKIADEIDKN